MRQSLIFKRILKKMRPNMNIIQKLHRSIEYIKDLKMLIPICKKFKNCSPRIKTNEMDKKSLKQIVLKIIHLFINTEPRTCFLKITLEVSHI